MRKVEQLLNIVDNILGKNILSSSIANNELTLVVSAENIFEVLARLKNDERTSFEQCMDLCGVDYLHYANKLSETRRFAVIYHLLSISYNWRIRVRAYVPDDNLPIIASVHQLWTGVNWFEREAFDLYGIVFEGHPDLRRLLTDYGFIGHPFRKDFPVTGYMEMKYDEAQKRVVYQPVTIEPREIIPRVVREDEYGRH